MRVRRLYGIGAVGALPRGSALQRAARAAYGAGLRRVFLLAAGAAGAGFVVRLFVSAGGVLWGLC